MKTARTLWTAWWNYGDEKNEYMTEDIFIKALAEHDKEIISLIDGLIEDNLEYAPNDFNRGYTSSLTELKQKIGEL